MARLSILLLVLAQVMISGFVSLSPTLGSALRVQSLLRILSLSLSLCPGSLACSLSLSQKIFKKIDKVPLRVSITSLRNTHTFSNRVLKFMSIMCTDTKFLGWMESFPFYLMKIQVAFKMIMCNYNTKL